MNLPVILWAFLIGGALCAVAQLVMDVFKLNAGHVMVGFVVLGAVLSGLGLYQGLVSFAGAGATVPLTGFGHTLVQGMLEDMATRGWIGVFTGGLKAASAGLTAAILFGYIAAIIFTPHG